eukprot:g1961.t1
MSSRVTPTDSAGQDGSSVRSTLLSLPQLRNRRQSVVKENILQNGIELRQLSHATKVFQSELEDFFEKCNDLSYKMLEKLVETELKIGELWAKAYFTKWRPTERNKRILSETIIQNCMIYLRSESIGRPDPRTVLKTFAASAVLDLFEFVAVANVFVFFFHWNEATAGWILLGGLIFERVLQVICSLAVEKVSVTSVLASLLGVKTFLTSYFIACRGPFEKVDGSKVLLVSSRLLHKGVNGIFLLAPQALLNAYLVFSKLKTGEEMTSTMQIQIFVVLAVCGTFGASMTNLQQENDIQRIKRKYYTSMTQILSKDSDRLGMAILKGGWNICHFTLVSCALGALMAKTRPYVWISIIVGFAVILNVMRYIINKGEMRFFLRIGSSWSATFGAVFIPSIVFVFGVGLMPFSFLRWHCSLGPTVYGVGWMSSFLISSISLIYLSSHLYLRIFFGTLIAIYVIVILAYFRYLKREARTTFLWSKENWKDILSTEWWNNPHYESDGWKDIHLIGNKDAHLARMIHNFLSTDLPWEKLVPWLKENKTTFKLHPPTWLSEQWLKLIPENQRNEVWNEREYLELCETIRRVEKQFRRKHLRNILFLEHTDDEEMQNDDQEKEKENGPIEQEIAVQQQQNAARQKIIENIKKRRSSFMGSLNEEEEASKKKSKSKKKKSTTTNDSNTKTTTKKQKKKKQAVNNSSSSSRSPPPPQFAVYAPPTAPSASDLPQPKFSATKKQPKVSITQTQSAESSKRILQKKKPVQKSGQKSGQKPGQKPGQQPNAWGLPLGGQPKKSTPVAPSANSLPLPKTTKPKQTKKIIAPVPMKKQNVTQDKQQMPTTIQTPNVSTLPIPISTSPVITSTKNMASEKPIEKKKKKNDTTSSANNYSSTSSTAKTSAGGNVWAVRAADMQKKRAFLLEQKEQKEKLESQKIVVNDKEVTQEKDEENGPSNTKRGGDVRGGSSRGRGSSGRGRGRGRGSYHNNRGRGGYSRGGYGGQTRAPAKKVVPGAPGSTAAALKNMDLKAMMRMMRPSQVKKKK